MLGNIVWIASCFPGWLLFRLACIFPDATQRRIIRRVVNRNQETDFGQRYNFARSQTVEDFRRNVPIGDYDSHRDYMTKILRGEKNVLVEEDILTMMPTSGTTAGRKYIPYTDALRREFQAGIAPWLFSLYIRHPRLFLGTSYWSITPAANNKGVSQSSLEVGFESDGDYLGKTAQMVLDWVMNAPSQIGELSRVENALYATLLFLLADRELALISVWSPTFIRVLFDRFPEWRESIITDISTGSISFPEKGDEAIVLQLQPKMLQDPRRAREIESVTSGPIRGNDSAKLWPRLRVISCWADGSSKDFLESVRQVFLNVQIQPKGLIATEGMVSFPLSEATGTTLSLRSHFFEFLEPGGSTTYLLSELEAGKIYEVILTTSGGLYRYRMGDLVEVVEASQVPRVRFVGRLSNVSDLFGEKLHEGHLLSAMSDVTSTPLFWMIAPERSVTGEVHYTLFLGKNSQCDTDQFRGIAEQLEQKLLANPHYKYARELGQLTHLHAFMIDEEPVRAYTEGCIQLGQKLGDVKMMSLRKEFGWSKRFKGTYV